MIYIKSTIMLMDFNLSYFHLAHKSTHFKEQIHIIYGRGGEV